MDSMQLSKIALVISLTAAANVPARERTVIGSRTGSGFSRSSTVIGRQGNSISRESTGARDAEAGTWNRSSTVTGINGQTAERSSSAARTEDGYSKSTTVTGPQGNTATREAQGTWDPETKTWSNRATVTGADGQTAERSTSTTKTDDGYIRSGATTGPQGNSATREAQGHWDPMTKTWTKTISVTGNGKQEEIE